MLADRHQTIYSTLFCVRRNRWPAAPKNTEHTQSHACVGLALYVILLAEEFEKLAKSWLRLAQASERTEVVVPLRPNKRDEFCA